MCLLQDISSHRLCRSFVIGHSHSYTPHIDSLASSFFAEFGLEVEPTRMASLAEPPKADNTCLRS